MQIPDAVEAVLLGIRHSYPIEVPVNIPRAVILNLPPVHRALGNFMDCCADSQLGKRGIDEGTCGRQF